MRIFLIVLQVIFSLVLIASVLAQPSKTQGLAGFISGGSETFFSKNKTRTFESTMIKITIISAILFAAVTIALNMI